MLLQWLIFQIKSIYISKKEYYMWHFPFKCKVTVFCIFRTVLFWSAFSKKISNLQNASCILHKAENIRLSVHTT